tara:strand:- start:1098 stop:1265 length:168 start_codon:yes stop_codon:yes gene_type:complete
MMKMQIAQTGKHDLRRLGRLTSGRQNLPGGAASGMGRLSTAILLMDAGCVQPIKL